MKLISNRKSYPNESQSSFITPNICHTSKCLPCGNLQQKIAEVELLLDGEFVIFAVTPVGYEKMSANLQEIKRYIGQQKDINVIHILVLKEEKKTGFYS